MDINDGKILVRKYVVKAISDINKNDTSQVIQLHLPGKSGYLLHFMGKVKTPFAGVTNPRVYVGISSTPDCIMPSQSLSIANENLLSGTPISGRFFCTKLDTPGEPKLQATFTSSSGNLSSLTAGEVEFTAVYVI